MAGINAVSASDHPRIRLNIPELSAIEALDILAEISGHSLFYRTDELAGETTNELDGFYTLQEAMDVLLENTHLNAVITEKGVIVVSTRPDTQINTMEIDEMKPNGNFLASMLGVVFGVGGAQVGMAAAGDQGTLVLEEVIVIARKISENLQDVPVAVNTLDSVSVRELDVRLLQDALDLTPGAMHYEYSKTEQTYTIRGVGSPAEGASGDSSVLLMEDGEVISRDFMRSAKMHDVARIEVLRGPQGTTYGRNAVGGVLHIINNRPHHDLERSATLTAGNYDFYSFDGVLNSGLTDTVAGRLSLHYDKRDGYTDNIADGKDIDFQENLGVRAQLLFSPAESLEVLVKATYEKDEDGPPPRKSYDPTIPYSSPFSSYIEETSDPWTVHNSTDPRAGLDRKVWSLGADVTWEFDDMILTSLTKYRNGRSEEVVDTFGSPDRLVFSIPVNDAEVFSQELRLDYDSSDSNYRWVAGLFYLIEDSYRNEDRELFTLVDGASSPVATLWYDEEWNDTESLGIFGEVEYRFSDKTTASLGLRYSRDDKEFDIVHELDGPLAPLIVDENPVIARGLSKSWNATTGKIALTHYFTEDAMFYANVATGYKSGGFGTQPPSLESAETPYNEENVINYEMGVKSEWFGRRLRTNVAIFRMDHDDIQTQDFSSSGAVIYGNAGKAETSGIEIEFQAAVTRNLTLQGSYSNYDAEYKTDDLADQNFANMPDWTGNLSAILDVPMSSGAAVRFRADYRSRSDIWHDKVNDPNWGIQPGEDIFNSRISYISADDRWEIALWGKNLTDKEEITNINTQAFMSQRTVGYGAPRTYGLSLDIRM